MVSWKGGGGELHLCWEDVGNTGMESREEPQGVRAQRRAGVEKLQHRLSLDLSHEEFQVILKRPTRPTLLS